MRSQHPIAKPAAIPQSLTARAAALAGAALIALAAHAAPAAAQDLGDQVARTPDTAADGAADLSDGFDMSFDAKGVIADTETEDTAPAATGGAGDADAADSAVTLHGVHALEISLYPDDRRSSNQPFRR